MTPLPRPTSSTPRALAVAPRLAALAVCAWWSTHLHCAAGADASAPPRLEFRRVHVPSDRLSEVPLGVGRYVPMSAREFEKAIARLSPAAGGFAERGFAPLIPPTADVARYDVTCAADGSLAGTVSFDVGSFGAGDAATPTARELPLGDLDIRSGTMVTAAGTGEAVVFGRQDGGVSVSTPEPGTYTCEFRRPAPAGADAQRRVLLPMVPALSSTVVLRLPPEVRPVVSGGLAVAASTGAPSSPDDGRGTDGTLAWRIDTGPRDALDVTLVPHDFADQRVSVWTQVAIRGRESLIAASVLPRTPWLSAAVRLRKDPATRVTRVMLGESDAATVMNEVSWREVDEGSGVVVDLPVRCVGGREPLVVSAVAPLGAVDGTLSLVRAAEGAWVGGGVEVRVAPALVLDSIETEHCMVVPPEAAARWPLPAGRRPSTGTADLAGEDGVLPTRIFLEEQSPLAVVKLTLVPRAAVVDVARVTTVDLSPGVVVGRAACDVRVLRGEAFDLTARITPGWFIDSVEAVTPPIPGESPEAVRRRDPPDHGGRLDWKVQRDARGDMLRIGLTAAATPARGMALRVTGHRSGIALGEDFPTSSIDMVRFDGESERSTLVEFRTSSDMTVEFDGDDRAVPVTDGRLAMLAEEGAVRGRIWGGHRAGSRTARLVRRRPPLDVGTQVRLTVRDDRLTESFTFECQPGASDLDSLVVRFSTPLDGPLEWSLLPPAVGVVSARRIDPGDGRVGQGATLPGGERWLVELAPAARGPVTIRAARTIPFTKAMAVPLAWVDGATTAVGQVIVRDAGRSRPRVVNRRLAEVPPDLAAADGGTAALAEFSYGIDTAAGDGEEPAAELLPNADPRAWVWQEITSSWCYASGMAEYETRFDIENQGRTSLSLSLPPDKRLLAIVLDGVRLSLGERPAAGATLRIELPAGRRFQSLLVRMVADAARDGGAVGGHPVLWRIDPAAIGIDIPVLQRQWRLFTPPDVDVAMVRGGFRPVGDSRPSRDWATRLLGAGVLPLAENHVADSAQQGFRGTLLVPAGSAGADAGVIVVRSRWLATVTVLTGIAAACAALLVSRLGWWPVLLLCLLAGVASLWSATPFDAIARAAWWGGVAVAVLLRTGGLGTRRHDVDASCGVPAVAAGTVVATLLLGACATAAAQDQAGRDADAAASQPAVVEPVQQTEPLRVFITPVDGGGGKTTDTMALVPEELFRVLVRGEGIGSIAPVRVLTARVAARVATDADGGWGTWRLVLQIDADAGGTLVLDQTVAGARFVAATALVDGEARACRLDGAAGLLRIPLPESGRHVVEVDVDPAIQRRGEIETATIGMPAAPVATLQLRGAADSADRGAVVCERLTDRSMFVAAPVSAADAGADFDVSRSAQVRLVRSLLPSIGLAVQPRTVASRNDIVWNLDECRLTASFEVEPGDGIVRSFEVVTDPALELVDPAPGAAESVENVDGVAIRPLDGRRFLVERRSPDHGRTRFEMSFRLRLDDPVGVFDVPSAWLSQADVDVRTVRFSANPSLAVRLDLPPGLAFTSIPEGEASFDTRSWRGEVSHPADRDAGGRSWAPVTAAPRLSVERRRQEIRGSQRVSVVFAADAVRLHLDARIDASSMALVTLPLEVPAGCVIDRVELFEDDMLHPDTAERGAIDTRWARRTPTDAAVVVQRPRAGRFRLEVDVRIPGRPAPGGALPCLRASLAEGARTVVDWRAEDGHLVRWQRQSAGGVAEEVAGDPAADGQFELRTSGDLPAYVLESAAPEATRRAEQAGEPRPPRPLPADAHPHREGRVELADIRLAADERGKVWGLARFEVVSAERSVRLKLPPAWRLFDVSVDGRSVEGVVPTGSQADNVWEFRLLDPGWPRSVVALLAGDVGRRLVDGEPFALPPPQIVGLPCRAVIWTMQIPEWIMLRVQEPARVVAAETLQAERRDAMARLDRDFADAIARMPELQQERLRAFFRARREGGLPDADETWLNVSSVATARVPAAEVVGIVGDGGPITLRAVRRRDPTAGGRAIATLSLLACCVAAWFTTRRGCPAWMPSASRIGPWLAMIGGMVWIAMLSPAWPGAALAVAGWAATAGTWLRHRRGGGRRRAAGRAESAANGLGPRVIAAGGSTTRLVPGDGGS